MAGADQIIFIVSLLLVVGIVAGLLSTRIGAPLLLAFLGLGVLVGPGGLGLEIQDRDAAYVVASAALALILFDGGLHTRKSVFRLALGPSLVLATLGVVVTAAIVACAARLFLGVNWLQGTLLGAIVSSTDAAAVLLLLHQSGRNVNTRLSATLETEAALNDPMAVFLTVACVTALSGVAHTAGDLSLFLLRQASLGIVIGLCGGALITVLVNRLKFSAGIYPILVMVSSLVVFAGSQMIGGSGYLAIYLAGLALGNLPHRSSQSILRFHEAIAWLSQLVLFILLGLLVVPARLLPQVPAGLAIAVALTLIGRPLAVFLCLLPFRFTRQEKLFVGWVGLRGAVPVFLALIPASIGLAGSELYFHVTFIVVLASLALQGWTIPKVARWLDLELPATAPEAERLDLRVAAENAREFAAWRVAAGSPAVERGIDDLHLPPAARLITILRDGVAVEPGQIDRLHVGDVVLVLAPDQTIAAADRLFAPPVQQVSDEASLGDFVLEGSAAVAAVAMLYGLPITSADPAQTVEDLLRQRLGKRPVVGDRVHLGAIDLLVREMEGERIVSVGVVVEPKPPTLPGISLRRFLARLKKPRG